MSFLKGRHFVIIGDRVLNSKWSGNLLWRQKADLNNQVENSDGCR